MPEFHLLAFCPRPVAPFTHEVECRCFLTESECVCAVLNETRQGDLLTHRGSACKTVTVMARPLAEMNCIARHTQ